MNIDMMKVNKILIIKMSSIGDIVHALPVAAALKKAYPHLHISWAVDKELASIVTGCPVIDHVIELPRRGAPAVKLALHRLKTAYGYRSSFDMTIDLQGLLKSSTFAFFTRTKRRIGYHWLREGSKLFEKPLPRNPSSIHVVDQYLDVAVHLGAERNKAEFPLHIPDEDMLASKSMLNELCQTDLPIILINPSAGVANKCWATVNFANLSDSLEQNGIGQTVFIGGKGDLNIIEQIRQYKKLPLRSLVGRTSLKQLMGVLRCSHLHIANDSGSLHIAAALGKPVVGIYGPTPPERTGPYGQLESALHKREECVNKSKNNVHCFCGISCVNRVTVEEVLAMAERKLKESEKAHAAGNQII